MSKQDRSNNWERRNKIIMKTNDIKKGMRFQLRNGWYATHRDRKNEYKRTRLSVWEFVRYV